jgi:hypothetical protein
MTIVAYGRALVECLIAKSADELFFRQLKEFLHGLICLDDTKITIINGKRVGDAVKNPGEKLFIVGGHICLPILWI